MNIEPNEWIGDPTTGYQPDDPSQGKHWCERCSSWDEDCECPYDPEGDAHNLELDKVEATCQWFDEISAKENAGGEARLGCGARVHVSSSAPLQLDYPVWRLSFSAYAQHLGLELP